MQNPHFESLFPSDSRFEEIKKLLEYIKSGNSAQLISIPGVGRSNILGLLAYNRQARSLHLGSEQGKFHFVMMNLSEIKGKELAQATKYIFLELKDSLEEREIKEFETVNKIFQDSIGSQDEIVIFQGLKKTIEYLCLKEDLTVVLLFDRFEEYIPSLTPQFFSQLRSLRDHAKYKFSVIFPVSRPLEESLGHDTLSDFYEFVEGNVVYLPIMDQKLLDFRISYLEKSLELKMDKKTLDEIENLTGGNGKLTRICIEEYSKEKNTNAMSEFLISKERIKAVLSEIWKSFTPFEQGLIQSGNAQESTHLVAVGLVKDNKIAIPLLEMFGKKLNPANDAIIYDWNKNEIHQGRVTISNGLTKSEFKLLKFMIQNPEKIIERDEAINAVWGNLESTKGVTEQALDQLVFRLRKKIEKDPTSPLNIHTIKGRGFKFSQ